MRTYGTMVVNFTTKDSRRRLLEDFNNILLKYGTVTLTSLNNEEITLDVDEYGIVDLANKE